LGTRDHAGTPFYQPAFESAQPASGMARRMLISGNTQAPLANNRDPWSAARFAS
jgi:hypothetical protein